MFPSFSRLPSDSPAQFSLFSTAWHVPIQPPMVGAFHGLLCWQLANELKCEIFEWTKSGAAARDFKFRDQIRDSSRSAPSNIAEGFGRFRPRPFANYLSYACASLQETLNHLIDAHDSKYIDDPLFSRLMNLSRAALRATARLKLQKERQAKLEEAPRRKPES